MQVSDEVPSARAPGITNSLCQSKWSQLRKAAGLPTGTLHVLRHTAATLALTSGVPVHIVAARLGDNPSTVLTTYAHLLPQSDELAAERVASFLVREESRA